jgi:hypothetical protein
MVAPGPPAPAQEGWGRGSCTTKMRRDKGGGYLVAATLDPCAPVRQPPDPCTPDQASVMGPSGGLGRRGGVHRPMARDGAAVAPGCLHCMPWLEEGAATPCCLRTCTMARWEGVAAPGCLRHVSRLGEEGRRPLASYAACHGWRRSGGSMGGGGGHHERRWRRSARSSREERRDGS